MMSLRKREPKADQFMLERDIKSSAEHIWRFLLGSELTHAGVNEACLSTVLVLQHGDQLTCLE